MNDYLTKPINPQKMAKTLDKYLSNSNSTKTAVTPASTPKATTAQELFNKDELLERMGGDENFVNKIIETFLEDETDLISILKEALDKKDPEDVRKGAHALKGVAANVSAGALRNVAYKLECCGKFGDLEHAHELFKTIEFEYNRLRQIFDNILQNSRR